MGETNIVVSKVGRKMVKEGKVKIGGKSREESKQ
jgi:hypothetical protein